MRKLFVVVTTLVFALMLVSPAAAQYGGTTITPSDDGTFNLSADPGSAVILDLTTPSTPGSSEESPAPAPITEVALDFAGAAEGSVAVTNFGAEAPAGVTPPPSGAVKAYYQFDLGSVSPSSVGGVTFTLAFPFGQAPAIWIQNAEGEWIAVPLVPVATDGTNIIYQVALTEVPTFFAVADELATPSELTTG